MSYFERKTYAELEEELKSAYGAMYKANGLANKYKSELDTLRAQAGAGGMTALVDAAGKFISDRMLEALEDRPDDTPLRVEVSGRNGFAKTITLGDLRALDSARDEALAAQATAPQADSIRANPRSLALEIYKATHFSQRNDSYAEYTKNQFCDLIAPIISDWLASLERWITQDDAPQADVGAVLGAYLHVTGQDGHSVPHFWPKTCLECKEHEKALAALKGGQG